MAYNTVSDRLREVYNAARRVDCLSQVEQSFRQEYLELVVQANVSKTTVELLEILQTSMRCRTRLRDMEKKMNVTTFVKRLTAGLLIFFSVPSFSSFELQMFATKLTVCS